MRLSEITSYVVLMSFYIKMMKRRTLQACSLRHSIRKGMFSELVEVGQGWNPPPLPPPIPLGYAPEESQWQIFDFDKVDFDYKTSIEILQTFSTIKLIPEAYLEPSPAYTIKLFSDFSKKSSTVGNLLGSIYASA